MPYKQPERKKPRRENILDKILCGVRCVSNEVDQLKEQLALFMSKAGLATKNDLKKLETKIMSAISEFATKQKDFNTRQSAAIDKIVTSTDGLTTDVKALNDKITELQNSPGAVTPEDQTSLNELQAAGESLAAKVEAVSTALDALDAQNPPVIPPVA